MEKYKRCVSCFASRSHRLVRSYELRICCHGVVGPSGNVWNVLSIQVKRVLESNLCQNLIHLTWPKQNARAVRLTNLTLTTHDPLLTSNSHFFEPGWNRGRRHCCSDRRRKWRRRRYVLFPTARRDHVSATASASVNDATLKVAFARIHYSTRRKKILSDSKMSGRARTVSQRNNRSNNNNNNWERTNRPRRLNVKTFTLPRNLTENNVLLQPYVNGQVYYLVKRPAGKVMLYSPEAFLQLMSSGPHARRVRSTNYINDFLTHATLNTVLFRNTQTRLPVFPKLVKKVRVRRSNSTLTMRNATRAATVMQRARRRAVARR